MSAAFQTIALIGKYKSPEVAGPLLALSEFLQQRGVRVLVDPLTASHLARNPCEVLPLEDAGKLADLAIVIGGDGTMLNIARTLAPYGIPLVGVNQGRLGFRTCTPSPTRSAPTCPGLRTCGGGKVRGPVQRGATSAIRSWSRASP